ncbi:Vacuolar protein sorting-associated protein 55 [Spathaspora sp. JA1]|nr:Vacuolar protein sorting-associated protein 55 [Spathaspora sp. JA1]
MNALNKIIFLSAFLASGFLLILLSCALFNNYKTLWVILIFLLAPLPNIFASTVENSRDTFLTFNDNENAVTPLQEFCKSTTGFLIISGIALPLVLYHTHLIELGALIMSVIGGLIVYIDIVVFIWFFSHEQEENDEFNF